MIGVKWSKKFNNTWAPNNVKAPHVPYWIFRHPALFPVHYFWLFEGSSGVVFSFSLIIWWADVSCIFRSYLTLCLDLISVIRLHHTTNSAPQRTSSFFVSSILKLLGVNLTTIASYLELLYFLNIKLTQRFIFINLFLLKMFKKLLHFVHY